jgi:hypothetical protein
MRVAHQKYKDDELKEVLYQGHALGKATIQYRKIDGVWKFAGLEPDIRWTEYDNGTYTIDSKELRCMLTHLSVDLDKIFEA